MADIKKYLDYEGLKTYHKKATSEYDDKYALKGEASDVDLSKYVSKDEFEKLKAEVDALKSKVN